MGIEVREKIYPIVKWVGGKRQLIDELAENMPSSYHRYFEPFVGGGALFFSLQPKQAYISDKNEELINMYSVVRDNVYELLDDLMNHKISKEYFLALRDIDRSSRYMRLSCVQRASRFIYLNKTCFNGMYRVNSRGQFNVPFGYYVNPRIVDTENLLKASILLQQAEIVHADFSHILQKVQQHDFVYFDPPYVPRNKTSNFTGYTKERFSLDMHLQLKDICDELDTKGVLFMLSNSDTAFVHTLYKRYEIKKVCTSQVISACVRGRGKVSEVLIKNYA